MTNGNDDEAALWAGRLDDGPLSARDERVLAHWLEDDPRRVGALLRAEACLAQVRRLRAVAPMAAADMDVAADTARGCGRLRRRFAGWLLAAGGTMAACAAGLMLWPSGAQYSTATGEVRRVPLHDGSVVAINTASSMRVDIDEARRRVMLDRGEAWFEVAHDRTRPFTVEVGPVKVRAVGTAFSLRRRADGVDLLVTEGVVEALAGGATRPVRVSAGQRTFLSLGGAATRPVTVADNGERTLAWRHGDLSLEGQTLAEAVAEINRYNRVQIAVGGPIATQPLVGYFRTNDPAGFARTAAALTGGRVVQEDDDLRIVAEQEKPAR